MDEELELDEESIMEMVASMLSEEDEEVVEEASCSDDEEVMEEGEEEDLYEELSDDMLDAIMEKLTVDMGATLSGWAGRSSEDMKHQMELEWRTAAAPKSQKNSKHSRRLKKS
jgi:hypothetical protein